MHLTQHLPRHSQILKGTRWAACVILRKVKASFSLRRASWVQGHRSSSTRTRQGRRLSQPVNRSRVQMAKSTNKFNHRIKSNNKRKICRPCWSNWQRYKVTHQQSSSSQGRWPPRRSPTSLIWCRMYHCSQRHLRVPWSRPLISERHSIWALMSKTSWIQPRSSCQTWVPWQRLQPQLRA